MTQDYVLDNHLAVYTIIRFPGSVRIDDTDIQKVIGDENLRPVSKDEFKDYQRQMLGDRSPERELFAWGNRTTLGEYPDRYTGTPYLDTDGQMKTLIDHVRVVDGWPVDAAFLFYQER
jgi:hypothetical protein